MHKFKIGGVEEAILSADKNVPDGITFIVAVTDNSSPPAALSSRPIINPYSKWNPLGFLFTIREILKEKPDILVCSLWRSIFAGTIVKLINRNIKTILFFHNERFNHVADKIISLSGVRVCDAIFVDSNKTRKLIERYSTKKIKVISFITRKSDDIFNPSKKEMSFIFFGRLNKQKRLDRALKLIHEIKHNCKSGVKFYIIGPDEGMLIKLKKIASDLKIEEDVEFTGPKSFTEIKDLCRNVLFYLQLSDHEGMGMSIIEAMQMGLVPIVTPVGEIPNYVDHMENGIIFNTISDAITHINLLVSDENLYIKLAQNSLLRFQNEPTYSDSFFSAIGQIK